MANYEHLDVASGIKLSVDTHGLTNGGVNVTGIEYDTSGQVGQLIEYINTNNISLDTILDIINKIDPELLKIENNLLNLTESVNNINFNDILNAVSNSRKDIINLIFTILRQIQPVIQEKIVEKINYIEVRTTYYVPVNKPQPPGYQKPKVERINCGPVKPQQMDSGWIPFGEQRYYKWVEPSHRIYFKIFGNEYNLQQYRAKYQPSDETLVKNGWISNEEFKANRPTRTNWPNNNF
jgi:hypothetical protein